MALGALNKIKRLVYIEIEVYFCFVFNNDKDGG